VLSSADIKTYSNQGFLITPPVITAEEISGLLENALTAASMRAEATIRNMGDGSLRLVYAVHESQPSYANLVRLPALLKSAQDLLGGDVYVHQTKVTLNTPLSGEGWPWHQDYSFWSRRDHLRRPDVLSAAVLLDRMTDVNGPLMLVPGSHRESIEQTSDGVLRADQMGAICRHAGIVAVQAPAGSVVYFDGRTVHGSAPNITPFERRVLYVTYNRTDNAPDISADPPPDYTCSRDSTPLRALSGKEGLDRANG
jgi:ectoine hydroxylase